MDLGFETRYDVTPVPGVANLYQVRTRQIPRHGMASLTMADVAEDLGLSTRTVRRLRATGLLKAYQPARRDWKVLRRDLDEYKRARGIPL